MKTLTTLACLALFASASTAHCDDDTKKKDEADKPKTVKTTPAKVRDITLQIPETWEAVQSTSSMRLATYALPTAKGDSEKGELTVFSFGGGGGEVGDNLQRWIGQFASDGRTAKITKGKAGEGEYYLADIGGTYNKPVGPPVLRKTAPTENYRMMGVILLAKDKGVYFLKLTGPDNTIKAQAEAFRRSFGGDSKTEVEHEI
jgi:gluconolactonase